VRRGTSADEAFERREKAQSGHPTGARLALLG
jgi:hypothetical protein